LHDGANPNAVNTEGETPLAVALNDNTRDVALIRNLLTHGVNPNIRMIERGERDSMYMNSYTCCQPLPGGGALLVVFQPHRDLNIIPGGHQYDDIGAVTLFRNGKLTDLGQIFMPK